MEGLTVRALALWALLGVTALVGSVLGSLVDRTTLGTILGVAVGSLLAVAWDHRRSQRLLDWLRSPGSTSAPRDAGHWGEIGYRMGRLLAARDAAIGLEQSRRQDFLSAIDASPNGVLLLDNGGQITWCNATAAQHFGLDPVRDLRQRVTNLVRAPTFVSFLQAGLFDRAVTLEGAVDRPTLSVLVRPYGEGMQLVLSQDITERERAEGMRRDFVANVSHEIRTPLTVLAGFVETLASLPLSEEERARVLSHMQQQTDRMQSLVGDLLTLARLEGSPLPGTDRWQPVAPLIERAVVDARALSRGRHEIDTQMPVGAEVSGNEAELLSAVANLLHNAVRYTPAGGRIQVSWRWRADDGADLTVTDTGIGIGREHLPRLTERFYRVDSSRSRDTGGTGLGLSIVKHVAQRHGGQIDVSSEPGKGSAFRVSLPSLRVRSREPAATEPVDESIGA